MWAGQGIQRATGNKGRGHLRPWVPHTLVSGNHLASLLLMLYPLSKSNHIPLSHSSFQYISVFNTGLGEAGLYSLLLYISWWAAKEACFQGDWGGEVSVRSLSSVFTLGTHGGQPCANQSSWPWSCVEQKAVFGVFWPPKWINIFLCLWAWAHTISCDWWWPILSVFSANIFFFRS